MAYKYKGTVSADPHGMDMVKSIVVTAAVAATTLQLKDAAGNEIMFVAVLAGDTKQVIMPGESHMGFPIDPGGTVTIAGDANSRVRMD